MDSNKVADAIVYAWTKYALFMLLVLLGVLILCAGIACVAAILRHVVGWIAWLGLAGTVAALAIDVFACLDEWDAAKALEDGQGD